jgi:carbon storage regulator
MKRQAKPSLAETMGSLVLSRKVNEAIDLALPDGRPIVVSVAEIRGDKVRLHISAPGDVGIHRREVSLRIAAEEARAAEDQPMSQDRPTAA